MTEKKILQISAGAVVQHVQVVLKDGVHHCCNLNEYCPGEKSGFIEKKRRSRTRFLAWLGFEEENAVSDIIAFGDFNTPDKETTYMKQSITEQEQNSEEYQGITCLDRTVIKTSIRQKHVSSIADSFQGSFDHFTTLLGLVDPGWSINNLAEHGAVKVQVFYDGNTKYRKDKSYDHVIMEVYEGLSEDHITMHNKSPNVNALSWRSEISTFTRKTVSIVFF
ncbi:hypothetical protein ACJMK2_002393 [Sinanodonta woodiana]|uniref:Endonuclease/exonuclease/phosphatase domain-containing protein n=1 Tax=Sinanodonta woodiana TaxID=1069815 RepID=A0ABD3XYI7_SINWO